MKSYTYDRGVDIFTITNAAKVKHSVSVGDFIVDFDKDNLVVGLEVLDASEHFGKLDSLEGASMSVSYKPSSVYVTLSLVLEGREKDFMIPLASPAAGN